MTFADLSGFLVSCFGVGFIAGVALGRVIEIFRSFNH